MKKILAPLLFTLSSTLLAVPLKNPSCSELTNVNAKLRPEYLAVIDGYNKTNKLVSQEVDVGGYISKAKRVVDECNKNKEETIPTAMKNVSRQKAEGAATLTLNPTTAKCDEFVGIGEEFQPYAVYWVAGRDQGIDKVRDGEIDEAFLSHPISTLVEECRRTPKASFYEKAKAWTRRHW